VAEIAEALTTAGVEVEKREVSLPEGPIRQVGEYEIDIHLHSDVTETIKVNVIAE
jgi:large subunit ribosomal protein L9